MKTKVLIAIIAVTVLLALGIGAFFLLRDEAKITLSFYSDGIIYHSEEINGKENIASPEAPSKKGYSFVGWYLDDGVWEKPFFCDKIAENPLNDNTNVYAKFQPIAYTITYITNGATHTNPQSYTIEDSITLTDAYKEGFHFRGWYTDECLQNTFTSIPLGSTGDITLYAKFEQTEIYTVTYSGIAGLENSNPLVYSPNTPTITLLPVSKRGYNFNGWFIGENEVTEITRGTTGNITLDARFTPVQYTITYLGANGISHINPTSYTVESGEIVLSDISKTGYTFDGWFDGAQKITKIEQGNIGNITLEARFTPIAYNITYTNTHGITHSNPLTYTIESADITLTDLSRDNYIFTGWFNGSDKVTKISFGSTGDIVLTAGWTVEGHTINYHNTENAQNPNIGAYNVELLPLTLLDASKKGYEFLGWYTDPNFENKIEAIPTGSDTDINLYAKWQTITYYATFKVDGHEVAKLPFTVETDALTEPIIPQKSGYTEKWESYTLGDSNIEINAVYSIITYKLEYENANGIINNNPKEYTVLSDTIILTDISKIGYTFDGWFVGDRKVTEIPSGSTENLVLTAKWTMTSYNITYYGVDGAQHSNLEAYNIGILPLTFSDASKEGYIFLGWYTMDEGGSKVTTLPITHTGNLKLYARWEVITYTASFYVDGNLKHTVTFTYFDSSLPSVPALDQRAGYAAKWSTLTPVLQNMRIDAVYTAHLSYEEYNALSSKERGTYYDCFADPAEFTAWFNAAKAKYEEEQDRQIIDDDTPVEIN